MAQECYILTKKGIATINKNSLFDEIKKRGKNSSHVYQLFLVILLYKFIANQISQESNLKAMERTKHVNITNVTNITRGKSTYFLLTIYGFVIAIKCCRGLI